MVYYAWGIVSLAALFAFQGARGRGNGRPRRWAWPAWEMLKELNTLLFVPGLVAFVGAAVLFSRWLTSTVPLVERRRATLERRTMLWNAMEFSGLRSRPAGFLLDHDARQRPL